MGSSINDECLTKLYNMLVSKYGKVTVTRGLDHSNVGMRFQFYHHDWTVNISMSGFLSDTITQSGLTGKSACPANGNLFIIKESPLLDIEISNRFHTFVAKRLNLSERMRPDLLTLVSFLTTRVQNPTEDDESKPVAYG